MDALVTLLLADGRPGHMQLSRGICASLACHRPLNVIELNVHRPRWLPARVLSTMTNAGGWAARAIPKLTGLPANIERCDLIVSSGGDTLAASVLLAKTYNCPNIFYGSLRRYRPTDFALVLTSYRANADRPRHAMTLKPSPFDPAELPVRSTLDGRLPVLGFLIGGDSGTVRFGNDDWANLLSLMTELQAHGYCLIVSNSRRTPASLSDQLARLATSSSAASISYIDVRNQASNALRNLFAEVDAVAVTIDSSSMVSEAIWAQKPVMVLAPKIASLPALEQDYRDYLTANGWCATIPLAEATTRSLAQTIPRLTPLADNPITNLAAVLRAKLPELFRER